MTLEQFLLLMMAPAGALLLGAWAYWLATRDDRNEPRGRKG